MNETMQTKHPAFYQTLNQEECAKVAESAYRILENTGCIIHNAEAREILHKAGGAVEGELVKIPVSLTKWAVEKAPSVVTLYDREGNPAMDLAPGKVYFGPAITITQIDDLETGKRRASVKADSANAAILMDALENVSWVSPCTSASDVKASVADIAELHAILPCTRKPVMYWSQSVHNLEYQFEMFEAVAGSAGRLAEKPFMVNLVCPMDPLTHTDDGMAQLIYLARRNSPAVYIAGIGFGLSGPITMAGGVAIGMADTLAGLVVSQLVNPGTPFIVSKFSDNVDMRTMSVTHSNPEMLVANAATADVFRYMGLPFCSNFGGTDSGSFDQIAAFDKSIQLYTSLLSGTNMNFALGAYESGAYAKFADIVFNNEIIGFLKVLTSGMEVSEETLAEDVIQEVGPGGVFLSEEHTLDHIHDFWEADLLKPCTSRQTREVPGVEEGLNQRVKEILAKGVTHPLKAKIVEKLDGIMARAEAEV